MDAAMAVNWVFKDNPRVQTSEQLAASNQQVVQSHKV